MSFKKVSRENDCKTMIELIRKSEDYKEISKNGLVILLNGAWGNGKTTFIEELKEMISKEDDLDYFFYYNSYEFDYYDNAYVPFFASLNNKIKLEKKFLETINNIGNETKNGLVSVGYNYICKLVEKKYDIDLKNIKETIQELDEEEQSKNIIDQFNNVKRLKEYIKDELSNISKDKKKIFVIDELDRCKPSFAMNTLEIVKHFFDLKNCIFIISVDKIQLEESMKSIYGIGIDGEKYFSKLFDYQFNLLPISIEKIFNLSTATQLEIVRNTCKLFETLSVSIRDSKKIFNELFKKEEYYDNCDRGMFLTFLLILKYTDLSFYNELFNINYQEWKERFKNIEDSRLSKYNNALDIMIGNIKIRYLLEEFIFCANETINNLQIETRDKLITFSIFSKKYSDIAVDILNYVCYQKSSKTIAEKIKMIIG